MKYFWKRVSMGVFVLLTALLLWGCKEEEPVGKVRDLEFTVLEDDAVPRALADVIAENKKEEMKLSYQNEGYLYIARGFGEQKTGGYSIRVQHCYLGEEGVHVKFELLGPSNADDIPQEASCPYIVIKMESMDETILFD